jgi:spore protease
VQNDILPATALKIKWFFTFLVFILHIVLYNAKAKSKTQDFVCERGEKMTTKRTDLALEARELWQESAESTDRLSGVKALRTKREGYAVTRVEILDERGAQTLGKPIGTYLTVDYASFWKRKPEYFERAVRALGGELKAMLPAQGAALVIGLGNRAMTPDAVGAETLRSVLITRHLLSAMPKQFSGFRPVSAFAAGVLGTTGVESAETVRGLVREIQPDFVIAVDALASRRMARLCATVQLSDAGIVPGSGVGNHRAALNQQTLGVPVYAVGIPTVVDAATLTADVLEESGITEFDEKRFRGQNHTMMVTPQDIDAQVRELSKVVGYAMDWALQELEIEEINALLS